MTVSYLLGYYLWVGPHLLLGAILFAMIRRSLHRQFPMFFLYTTFEILQFVVLFVISRTHVHFGEGYVRVYSVGLALSTAIRFGVIHELFNHFFRRYPALSGPGRYLFRAATVALLLVATGVAISTPGKSANFLLNATYALDRTVSVLQCGLLILLFLFSRQFALSWRSPAIGIALGLGVFACVELAASAIRLYLGVFGNRAVNLFTMATYHCCVLIWMFYLMRPERITSPVLTPLPEHNDLDIWNQELQRLLQR
jgi:hypothetical protein